MEVESVMPLKLFSKPRRRKIGPEACLQITVVEYLRLAGVPGLLYFSVPNEQKCSVQRGAMLKRMGRLPGVSDLVIVIPRAGRNPTVLFLELKAKGEKPSEEQVAFAKAASAISAFWDCADNIDDAILILRRWGAIRGTARRRPAASTLAKAAA